MMLVLMIMMTMMLMIMMMMMMMKWFVYDTIYLLYPYLEQKAYIWQQDDFIKWFYFTLVNMTAKTCWFPLPFQTELEKIQYLENTL